MDTWDATVWVDAPLSVTVPRGNARFPGRSDRDPDAPSNRRYVEGQRLYIAEAAPSEGATWVLDNTHLERPTRRSNGGELRSQVGDALTGAVTGAVVGDEGLRFAAQ